MNQDQIMGLLRQVLPIAGTLLTVFGVKSATANAIVDMIMTVAGPAALIWSAIWAFIANSRASVMASAAKPVEVGAPAPQIVLPRQEEALANALPANVTSK
jgi:hypothetical protein